MELQLASKVREISAGSKNVSRCACPCVQLILVLASQDAGGCVRGDSGP